MRILLKNFEIKLNPQLCQRGYDYYCEGRINHVFRINEYEWHALVQGFDEYIVNIKIDQQFVIETSCNCNHGNEKFCKHSIAVLYHIRNEGLEIALDEKINFKEIRDSLSYLPPHVLRHIILKFATENKTFRKYLQDYFDAQK